MYEESVRYYVRALAMNPKADNAWQYLRISLRYAGRYPNRGDIFWAYISFKPEVIQISSFFFSICSSASRNDMLEACDSRNLDVLQKEFPL